MAIDPYIARGVQPVQIENPLNAMAQMYQLKNAQQAGKLNAMALQTAEQDAGDRNKLRAYLQGTDLSQPEARAGLVKFGAPGLAYGKQLQEQDKAGVDAQKAKYDLAKSAIEQSRALLANVRTPEDYIQWHMGNHQDPVLGKLLAERGVTADKSMANIQQMLSQPGGLERAIQQSALGAEKFAESLQPKVVGRSLVQLDTGGKPNVLYTSPEKADKPAAEPAPTMTEVIDPADPKRMLRVNARTYQGGSLGSPGVLGISGKEPTSAAKDLQSEEGRANLDTQVAQLRDLYGQLRDGGGITQAGKGASNLAASASSSTIGQMIGGALGTQNQSLRDSIIQQRPLLLQAIKQATGMSAKQMDSNAEMKMYLAAATDPTMGYEANMRALDTLLGLFGPKPGAGGAAPTAPAAANQDAEALNWANANPGDPRAAAIKQSLGVQ